MTTTAQKSLYDVIADRRLTKDRLPTSEELDECEKTLHGAGEFFADPIMEAVVQTANVGEPNSVSYEEIGRLLVWASHMRAQLDAIGECVEQVEVSARDDLYLMAEGYEAAGTTPLTRSLLARQAIEEKAAFETFRAASAQIEDDA